MASKSLGTLTLDLVAQTSGFVAGMDKAERSSAKWRKQVSKDAAAAGKAVGIAAAAAVTALTALVAVQIREADQSRKTAQAIGVSTEAYTALSFAASQSGVSQSQLTAGLGRLNRSILEASDGVATYADSFDALDISVTDADGALRTSEEILGDLADKFQDMPDGVEKSARAMELLGRSGAALIPLLNGGSEGIEALTRQAEALGLVISDETAMQAELFNDSLAVMAATSKGVGNQLAAELLPALSDLASGFADVVIEGEVVPALADNISTAVRTTAKVVVGAAGAFELAGKYLGGFAAILAAVPDGWDAVSSTFDIVKQDLSDTALSIAETMDKIDGIGSGDSVQTVSELADMVARLREESSAVNPEIDKTAEAIAKQIAALEFQAQTVGMTSGAITLLKLQLDGATQSQLEAASAALDTVAAYGAQAEAAKKAAEEQRAINDQALSISDSLRTEEQMIEDSYARRREIILKNTEITGNAQAELLAKLEEKKNDQLDEINAGFWERYLEAAAESLQSLDELSADMISNVAQNFGSTLESIVFDAETLSEAIHGLAEGFLRTTVNAIGQLAAEWLAYQAIQLAVGKTTQASSASTQTANALASQQMAALNAFASTAAIPIVGPVAAPAAAAAALAATTPFVAAVSASAISGIAHEGIDSIPQTGTWLLEKGERVTTAKTSAKLDSALEDMKGGKGNGSGEVNLRVVNSFDSDEVVGGYMGSADGERMIMNVVRKNQRTVKALTA